MSKVKHLLRKLHIGGGGFTDDHHDVDHSHRPVVNSPPAPPPPPSPPIPFDSSFSTSPSSSSALQITTALVDSADNSNLHSDSIDNSNSNLHADSIDNSNSNLHADSIDFNILEEEFQVQLALAISVSDHDAREDRESVQINTAKQISLGCSPSETLAEFLSLKYWSYNVLNYDEKVMDGFYDVYGISSNSLAQGKMPSLVDLEAIFVSDYVDYEVILVNRTADLQLRMLEERVYSMYLECRALEECLIMVSLVQKIADIVVDRMGGPVTDTEEMLRKWNNRSCELRSTLNTIILPLGFLDVGLSRHRALLFKVLSDSINLSCKVVKGSYYIDTDEGAVNFVKVGNGSEYIIDLMGAPGTLIPIEVPSSHHQRSGLDTRSMAAVSSTARYSCSVLNNDTGRVATLPDFNGLPGACSSNSKESSFFGTQLSHHVDDHPGNYEHKKTRIINNLENNKESALQLMESTKNLPMDCSTNSERIDGVLGGAAEWEVQWEELQIGERIGIGSYGEVFRAECKGTEVAVKKFMNQDISGDALEQFKCEVEIMLRLRHPNVVLFMGAVTHPPNLSILTEFLPRGSLFKLLRRSNIPIDEKRRIRMALDVAKGMNYLHTSHPVIVHRDLKSPNLLVDKNWVVKVCDFGMSRMKHHTFLSSKSTAGTPEWMAPEILRNEPSNEKSDVYSFGVILWELTTLRVPWIEMNSMQVVGAVGYQNRHLNIPAEVDPMVAEIITDCWNPDQHARPSFGKIITRLKCLQQLLVQST